MTRNAGFNVVHDACAFLVLVVGLMSLAAPALAGQQQASR
jgi:hypothetical protein